MQTIIQITTKSHGSLRDRIVKDSKLEDFDLVATEQKRNSRANGWAKLKSTRGVPGAINLKWHGDANLLICRVVNKLGGKPNSIAGDFVDYLLARHRARILTIQILPP